MRFARLLSFTNGAPFDLAATPKLAARLNAANLKVERYRTVSERIAAQR
jgi:hypothetical protein